MGRVWEIFNSDNVKVKSFVSKLGISYLLARLLLNRGIVDLEEVEKFLSRSLYDLPDPFKLKDMAKVVQRFRKALYSKEKIMILSDYDVDGVTSLALLWEFFNSNNVPVIWYLPHRINEGYGISENAVQAAKEQNISLFISLDCGITAFNEIQALKNSGIDVVIIDHHRPKADRYPKADAIIDPWQEGCSYPEKDLAAVGLVFKVLEALLGQNDNRLTDFLDLVCLGTVADLSNLKGENRILVKYGFQVLRHTKRIGLKGLFESARLKNDNVSARNISFILAPRLNAAGRVGSAEDAFKLLITNSEDEAKELSLRLESANKRRRKIETDIFKEVLDLVDRDINFSEQKFIITAGENWHPGVLGIVASKLTERYFRPSIVLSEKDGILRGSGRSIPEFNIFEAVSKCSAVLEEFGGHAAACGVTLKKENLNKVKQILNKYASEIFSKKSFVPRLEIDTELNFSEVNEALFKDIEILSPFGSGNPEPLFLTRAVRVISKPQALSRGFYKFWLKQDRQSFEALLRPRDEEELPEIDTLIDIAYRPSQGEWEGVKSVTLFLEDYREAENTY